MNKTSEMLQEMARLTALSGRICEIQEFNLKNYPFIYFNGVREVTIKFDLTTHKSLEDEPTKNANMMTYNILIDQNAENDNLDKRYQALEKSVHTLLWNDISVEIFINGQLMYPSKNETQ